MRTLLSSTGSTTSIRLCCESAFKPSQVGALYSRKHQACGEDAPKQSRGGLGSCKRLQQASKPKPSGKAKPEVTRYSEIPCLDRGEVQDLPRRANLARPRRSRGREHEASALGDLTGTRKQRRMLRRPVPAGQPRTQPRLFAQ